MYISVLDFIKEIGEVLILTDIIIGLFKAFCFGIIISCVCLFSGFKTGGEKYQIFEDASDAAIESFIYCMLINIAISLIFLTYS